MSMTLTTDDLTAIEHLTERLVTTSEQRMIQRIDELDDTLSRQTAAGFAEVHDRLNGLEGRLGEVEVRLGAVEHTVGRIEQVQQTELERNDHQDQTINKMRKVLRTV